MPKRGRETEDDSTPVAIIDAPPLVTVKVMKGSEATSVKVDPSKYGFVSIQLQDEAYAQQFINTDEVIADLSEAALGPEFAADIATSMDVADGRVAVTNVRLAAQTLRGADYLQLREELYLKQVVTVLKQAAAAEDSDAPPTSPKEVVPCVHTGQLMWDRLGAYTVLRLEQMGIISLGHKGIIDARDTRINDSLLALASVLNKVTSLNISLNRSITTCEPFVDTLVELKAAKSGITDEGLKLCTQLRKLDVSDLREVTSCVPFAETLEELVANCDTGITDVSLECCRKIRKLSICMNPNVTTCAPFADTLEELSAWGRGDPQCNITDASLKCCRNIRKLSTGMNPNVTTCAPFADTLEELQAGDEMFGVTLDAIQGCTKLRKLCFFGTPKMTTCESLKDLEELTPSAGFTEASLEKVAEQCHRLKKLDLSCCADEVVTDGLLKKFTENCHHLQSLNVSKNVNITDLSITALAKNCPHLRTLDVSEVVNITDTAIIKVVENCPKLESLIVSHTSNITDASIQKVAEHCPRQQILSVAHVLGKVTDHTGRTEGRPQGVMDASVREIVKNCPPLIYYFAMFSAGKLSRGVLKLLSQTV